MSTSEIRVLAWPARRKRADNPYTYQLQEATASFGILTEEFSARALVSKSWDIIHIHWPEMAVARGSFLAALVKGLAVLFLVRIQRLFGASLVWTIHNLEPHEARHSRLTRWYFDRFLSMVDGLLSPSESGHLQALDRYPSLDGKPLAISRIGHYRGEYPAPSEQAEARTKLGLSEASRVILCFGQIRPYKGLVPLAELVTESTDANLVLLIAGPNKSQEVVGKLERLAEADRRVCLDSRYIPAEDVPDLLAACDVFAAPFASILNSSSALLALSYDCPVVAPRIGAIPELARDVGPGWIHFYDGELKLEDLEKAMTALPGLGEQPDLSLYEWPAIGEVTARLFRDVSERKLPPRESL